MEQYFQEAVSRNDSNKGDDSSVGKWKSVSDSVKDLDNAPSAGFDCSICLESVRDPVVTLCGHLFCWPCIYKWLHFQSTTTENPDEVQQQCPVCKAEVSRATLVPLYGRGRTTKPSNGKAPNLGIVIPRRPMAPACGFDSPTSSPRPSPRVSQPYYTHPSGYIASPMLSPGGTMSASMSMVSPGGTTATSLSMLSRGGTTATDLVNPMFGEMIYSRLFGNPMASIYNYPNSYNLAGSSSPRVRRHVMQAEKSLNRICFFLLCCFFLFLVLF